MSRSYYSGSSGTPNYVDGAFVESETTIWHAVHCPADGTLLTKTPESLPSEVSAAVASSLAAFPAWSRTAPLRRAEILADLAALVRERTDDLCELIVAENGKTGADAEGDVLRGLQVLQSCSAVPSLLLGDNAVVSESVTTATYLEPIGVTVGICPFNFPAMIPLWSFPVALACGNTHILSPAQQTPGASMLLAALASDAGVPDGVLNVVHGAAPSASQLCSAPGVAAVSFVGGSVAGRAVHAQASVRSALDEKPASHEPRALTLSSLVRRPRASACSATWARRTTAWSCPTPTPRTRPGSSPPLPSEQRGSAAWRSRSPSSSAGRSARSCRS
jgi:malonate-semialdehyde dehydrogenase (acetylating)/methylmalonate-semialdehyde dehydrogenase